MKHVQEGKPDTSLVHHVATQTVVSQSTAGTRVVTSGLELEKLWSV